MNIMLTKITHKKELIFLVIVHLAGIIGIKWINTDFFLQLSFVSLIIPLVIIIDRMKLTLKSFFLLSIVYSVGFVSEWFGVNGGFIFGDYIYGKSLGFKVGGVPLLIGLNWLLLTLASREIAIRFFSSPIFIVLFSALIMLGIDCVIEPVAHKLDFWSWSENKIPFSNYRDWFIVAVVNQIILIPLKSRKKVFSLALGYLIILTVFFLCFY